MLAIGYVTEQDPSVTSRRGRFVEAPAPAYAICKSVGYMSVLLQAMHKLSLCTYNDLNVVIGFHAIVEGTGRPLVIGMWGLSFAAVRSVWLFSTSLWPISRVPNPSCGMCLPWLSSTVAFLVFLHSIAINPCNYPLPSCFYVHFTMHRCCHRLCRLHWVC